MRQVRQPPVSLERVDLCLGSAREDLVDVGDDGFDVRGAVLRHVLPDGLEVTPEVSVYPMSGVWISKWSCRHPSDGRGRKEGRT